MMLKNICKTLSIPLLAVALVLMTGCGGGDSDSVTIDSAEVSRLQAKVAEGDSEAAMKLGEMHAAKAGDREAQIEAAKWFHIAGRLGNGNAQFGLAAVTSNMTFEEQTEAEQRGQLFKLPAKQ